MSLYHVAETEWAADEARQTIKGYHQNVIDEGERLALERLQRDVSKETLHRLFPHESAVQTKYVSLVHAALPELAIYLK